MSPPKTGVKMTKRNGHGGKREGAGPPAPPLTPSVDGPTSPGLVATTESVEAYIRWAQAEFDEGRAEPRYNDQRMKLAGEMRKVVALRHGLDELEQLRALVKASETAANQRKANETADRYGQGADAPPFGRVPLVKG